MQVQDGAGNILSGLTILDRGYTGHEHLQSVGLIHMNGRLYDPKLHRFLQPDNYVQDPSNTQNYNRYGYVLNNPLKYNDPSGEFKINWNDIIAGAAIVVGVALSVFSYGTLTPFTASLIGSGLAHFGAAYAEYSRTGDWDAASNNAGISFGTSFDTNWGYKNDKDKKNGVAKNESVVKPKADSGSIGIGREEYDPTGGILTGIGTGFTASEIKMYNKSTWFSVKQWKTYSQSFNGNGYTGGKIASALEISKGFKWAGRGLGAYNALSILNQYNNNEISGVSALMEESSNAYSTFGGLYGAYWGIGWEGGRAITKTDWYQDWKKIYWYPWRYEHFGY